MALPSPTVETPSYALGSVVAGKYRLDALLGEGGMGLVYRAFNLQLEAPVALKLIRAGLNRATLTQRLKNEAKAAARLGHSAIVRVFDVGESEQGDPFIVMELLNGRTLAALITSEQRLPAPRAVQLLLPVADALSIAHAKGLVHRDLKPDNVFIVEEDGNVQPKLVDFGIVKIAGDKEHDAHLTQSGTVLGSPEYMSPEQARGQDDLDLRTDIWSFCVVLYEAVAGSPAFTGTNYNALLRNIVERDPLPLQEHLAGDAELWAIIERGLSKDRDKRFRSMGELGRALAGWAIARGVREDACGASLEAKWISRSSDPAAGAASRASFSSLDLPPSGVRETQRPLHDPSAATAAFNVTRTSVHVTSSSRKPRRLIALGAGLTALTVVGGFALVIHERGTAPAPTTAEPALSTARAPAVTPAAVAPTVSVAPVVSAAPSAPAASAAAPAPSSPGPRSPNAAKGAPVKLDKLDKTDKPVTADRAGKQPARSGASPETKSDLISPY